MTFRHLEIFMSVYQNQSITKASKELHISQPSVSLAIKELEEKLSGIIYANNTETVKFILQKKLIFYIIIHYRFFHLLKIWKMKCMKTM